MYDFSIKLCAMFVTTFPFFFVFFKFGFVLSYFQHLKSNNLADLYGVWKTSESTHSCDSCLDICMVVLIIH
jgi:hypothetical protein